MHQKIQIIGNLGRDPEMRYTPKGKAVTSFSVATSRTWVDGEGETHNETTWFRVVTWGARAEACNQYLKKGSKVFVEGHLLADKSTGGPKVYEKNDHTWSSSFEIEASEVKFLDGGSATRGGRTEEEEQPEYMRD